MAIARIEKYLANPDKTYEEGRMLYEQYGNNVFVLAVIQSGSGAYHFKRLIEALEELSKQPEPEPAKQASVSPPKKRGIPPLENFYAEIRGETTKPDYETLPESIKRITVKKNQHYRRALQLFAEMPFVDSQDERAEMAFTLLDDHDEVQKAWRIIDDFKETGKELLQLEKSLLEQVNSLSLEELTKESKNLPPNISKARTKLKDLPDGRKRVKVLAKLQGFEKRFELVKARIKQLSDEQQSDR